MNLSSPRCITLMIGTCTLGRIVNVIKESELGDGKSLLLVKQVGHSDGGLRCCWCPTEEGAAAPKSSQSSEIDKLIFMKENMRLGLFQTQLFECRTRPLLEESPHVMVMPLKAGESQPGGAQPLPPALHVLHAYTRLKMSNNKVSVVVKNMSDCPIFLKKGIQVARVVSASPVLPAELSPKMEAILRMETAQAPMSVTAW